MTFSSFLGNKFQPLILDTSVLINLYASARGASILDTLPNRVVVPELVAAELEHETSKENGEHRFIQALLADGIVELSVLTEQEYALYERLVTGENSLDDGEAATIAIAVTRQHVAIVDERRGRKHASRLMPAGNIAWSVDLILHPAVAKDIGHEAQTNAVYLALRDGRMRIHEDHCDQVVALIGARCALDCVSIPGYKHRRLVWKQAIAEASDA